MILKTSSTFNWYVYLLNLDHILCIFIFCFRIYGVCLQDNVRNQLIQFELLLTTATFVVAIFGVVAGIFGMNFEIDLFEEPGVFKWVLTITGVCGVLVFLAFLWFYKRRRLMPL